MSRKFAYTKPQTQEETIAAIYEELSDVPLEKKYLEKEQTTKGYLHAIYSHIQTDSNKAKNRREQLARSESYSIVILGIIGLVLVFISSQKSADSAFWNSHSYFFFSLGTILTVMFVVASIERSSIIGDMFKYSSVKLLCAFLFSAAVIYSGAQANTILNLIFRVDGSNFPFARAILSAAYFLKICTPVMGILVFFILLHILVIWGTERKNDFYTFPWNSLIFILAGLIVGATYWGLTHSSFGDDQMRRKAYKLTHYLDFNNKAFCTGTSDNESYIFLGSDQNKILIDKRLSPDESLEEFLKGTSFSGSTEVPEKFRILNCNIEGL